MKCSELFSRTNKCGETLGRTAKLAENCEPEKDTELAENSKQEKDTELAENGEQEEDTAELAENGEQEEDIAELAENNEQEEDTAELAENGEQEEDTAELTEIGEQEEDTELAENWEDCGSGEESCTEQYLENGQYEEDAQDLTKLLEFQEVEIGELLIENEQLIQENTKLQEEIDQLRTQGFHLTHLCHLSSQLATVAQQQVLSITRQAQQEAELSDLSFKDNDDKVCFYTGLPNYEVFEKLYQLLEPLMLSKDDNKSSISLFDELLMVLVKLS